MTSTDGTLVGATSDDPTAPLTGDQEPAQAEAPEAPAEPTHAPVPGDAQASPPRDDGINLYGYFRRPTEDGGSEVVRLGACENERTGYEAKGFVFEGYAPE